MQGGTAHWLTHLPQSVHLPSLTELLCADCSEFHDASHSLTITCAADHSLPLQRPRLLQLHPPPPPPSIICVASQPCDSCAQVFALDLRSSRRRRLSFSLRSGAVEGMVSSARIGTQSPSCTCNGLVTIRIVLMATCGPVSVPSQGEHLRRGGRMMRMRYWIWLRLIDSWGSLG